MWPALIAAAVSILGNKQKQDEARQAQYLEQLMRNAQRFGGNTDMASVISGNRQIDNAGADYGPMLKLVGDFGSGDAADSAPAPGAAASAAQSQLDRSFVPQAGGDENDLLDPWKYLGRRR